MWGDCYKNNEEGVTGLLALTEKGTMVINGLKDSCTFELQDLSSVLQGQMATSPIINWILRKWIFNGLRSNLGMNIFYKIFFTLIRINRRLKRIFS